MEGLNTLDSQEMALDVRRCRRIWISKGECVSIFNEFSKDNDSGFHLIICKYLYNILRSQVLMCPPKLTK